jgi:hypothetical protein
VSRTGRVALRVADGAAALTGLQCAYLLGLCVAALRQTGSAPDALPPLRLVVLVPAHDERLTITDAVRSLTSCEYPPDHRTVIVIADNCGDETAQLAREAGAEVLERHDPMHPGKGEAVAWALTRLRAERPQIDAVVMMDADCIADPELLRACANALAAGAEAVQGAFLAANPDDSQTAALRWAGYALMNRVRPAGRDALGLSCGLSGSGMAFTRAALERVPWQAFSVTEDKEQHLRLVESGVRVRFVSDAVVRSPMPTEQATAETQQMRWETGNVALARRWVPRLTLSATRERDAGAANAVWELLVPPLSLLAACQLGAAGLGRLTHRRSLKWCSSLGLASLVGYVTLGLAVARAPVCVYRAMLGAPGLILRRLRQYAGLARGRGHQEWRRSARS